MTNDELSGSYLERAWEEPEEVVLRQELVRNPALQPEDLGVLAELLLRDPRLPSTMEAIRKDLQVRGWKMGKDRYNAIAGRLTKAGHLARVSAYDAAAQRPTWVTRVYRNPANNQQYVDLGVTTSMQVNAEMRETRDSAPGADSESRETRVSPGQSRIAGNPQSGAESRETRDSETRVSPGQSRIAGNPQSLPSSPTPPGGLVNPPTVPPRSTTPQSGVAAVAGGRAMRTAQTPTPEQLEAVGQAELDAAGEFLANLPGRWACGPQDVAKYAQLLAEGVARQGWLLGAELEGWLTAGEGSIRGAYPRVIPARLKNLPRYQAWTRSTAPTPAGPSRAPVVDPCPNHPHREAVDCRPCQVATDDDAAPQPLAAEPPVSPELIAKVRAFALKPSNSRGRRDKSPRADARSRRSAAAARAEANAQAEEDARRKADELLDLKTTDLPGMAPVPGQAHEQPLAW